MDIGNELFYSGDGMKEISRNNLIFINNKSCSIINLL